MKDLLQNTLGDNWYLYVIGLVILLVVGLFVKFKLDAARQAKWEANPAERDLYYEKQIKKARSKLTDLNRDLTRTKDADEKLALRDKIEAQRDKIDALEAEAADWKATRKGM